MGEQSTDKRFFNWEIFKHVPVPLIETRESTRRMAWMLVVTREINNLMDVPIGILFTGD
jgi:hypothetical protein